MSTIPSNTTSDRDLLLYAVSKITSLDAKVSALYAATATEFEDNGPKAPQGFIRAALMMGRNSEKISDDLSYLMDKFPEDLPVIEEHLELLDTDEPENQTEIMKNLALKFGEHEHRMYDLENR